MRHSSTMRLAALAWALLLVPSPAAAAVLRLPETTPVEGPSDEAELPAYDDPPVENPTADEHPKETRRGRIGFNLLGGYSPSLAKSTEIAADGLYGIQLLGGAMLGPKRQFLLAAHARGYVGVAAPVRLPFSGYSAGLLGQQNWILGRRDRFLVGAGGIVGVTGQKLGIREVPLFGTPYLYICTIGSDTATARRTGALFSPRAELAILFGAQRRGMISLGIEPSFSVFGDAPEPVGGSDPGSCGQSVFTRFGLPRRFHFQVWAGMGLGFRF